MNAPQSFCFQTESVDQANLEFTKSGLPKLAVFETHISYDARRCQFRGDQDELDPHMRAYELALLTLKECGSARKNYRSVSTWPVFQVTMHIGAKVGDDFLIVSDAVVGGELVRPAKLSLNDLIGYEVLKRF